MKLEPYRNWSICRAGGLRPGVDLARIDLGSGEVLRIASASDSHPPEETEREITRNLLITIRREVQDPGDAPPILLRTRFGRVMRDRELLAELRAAVEIPLPTLKPSLAAGLEPGSPAPRERLALLRRLADAGIEAGVVIDPVLPGMTDRLGTLNNLVRAAARAGARWISGRGLRLPAGTRRPFFEFLRRERPGLVSRYTARFQDGADPPGPWEERVLDMLNSLRVAEGIAAGPAWSREGSRLVAGRSAGRDCEAGDSKDPLLQLRLPFAAAVGG